MTTLNPIITADGLAAVFNAESQGLSASIAEVALGDAGWTPDNTATALQNEKRRVPVQGGERVSATQIHITAVEDGTEIEYWVRELGFYLADGTLLAVWSTDQQKPLAYKSTGVNLLLSFDLLLSALPDNSVTIDGSAGFSMPPANETRQGIIRIATTAEIAAGTATNTAVTPAQLPTNRLTNAGDLLVHDGTAPARLAKGTEGQVLQMVNDRPAWHDQWPDVSRRVWKLAKVNGLGGWRTRVYLMADGTIRACGLGDHHSNGDPNGSHTYLPSRVATEDPEVRFVEVFSGGLQHYALTAEGEVWSWGRNNYGQLGHGDTTDRAVARRINFFVDEGIKIAKIVPGRPNYHEYGCGYFLTTDGRVYACGYNGYGNLGDGTTTNRSTPVRCGSLENIVDIAVSGLRHSIYVIQANGQLWVWGYNSHGQLGLGDATQRNTPIDHPSVNTAARIVVSSGYRADGGDTAGHSLVLLTDGTIWTTGYNGYGQLGLGDTTNRSGFTQINHSATFVDIFAGDGRYPSCGAISDQGEIYLWGYNYYGQLGTGNSGGSAHESSPVKPNGSFQGQVTRARFGGGTSYEGCILQAGNALWAAGYSEYGNLGTGSGAATNSTFQRVLGQSGVIKNWDCFGQGTSNWGLGVLYEDGRVDACGYNGHGETGTQSANLHEVRVLKNVIF